MKSGLPWPLIDQDGVATDVTNAETPSPTDASSGVTTSMAEIAPAGSVTTHTSAFVIDVTYSSNVTSLQTTDPTLYSEYTSAVQVAVQYYESEFTNSDTVDITFNWAPLTGGASGESDTAFVGYTYTQLHLAVAASETTSGVQTTAVATLPAIDPTGGATFVVATAEARALGLPGGDVATDGTVTLDSSHNTDFAWTRSAIGGDQEDAIGTLEHEISEVLGRSATSGAGNEYELLDMFRYTAANGGTNDAPGSAAGAQDEPFVNGYNANAQSYFSFDGAHVTLPFETPADVASGSDVADWSPSVNNDSYADGPLGQADTVSPTDLEVMNVLGYDLSCFAAGTRIATPAGECAVEHLSVGDRVLTRDGSSEPVVWVGSRVVDCRAHPAPEAVAPVRVAKRAFGAAGPVRDLFLSPDHAVFVNGVLVPIKLLVNGTTIAQECRARVTYHHIGLSHHSIILAEGLTVESYLDVGDRANFVAGGDAVRLFPDFGVGSKTAVAKVWETRGAAPLVITGEALETARRSVAMVDSGQFLARHSTAGVDLRWGLRRR
jgi:collagen type I/II/III/V/XI/XXIV/XXVII alpha